jgi:hypothetical protein
MEMREVMKEHDDEQRLPAGTPREPKDGLESISNCQTLNLDKDVCMDFVQTQRLCKSDRG